MFDIIIIGGGPAGITAGIYAARKKLNTLVISKDFIGQVGKSSLIENWPGTQRISGVKYLENLKKHLEKFMVDINEGEEVVGINKKKDLFEIRTTQKDRYFTKSIIIASGTNPRPLEIPGEKEFVGRGVSYCTTCDAPFFKDKTVAVIGGGNAGLEAALDLARYAKKIYILEFSPEIKADEFLHEKAKKDKKIEVILSAQSKEIKGTNLVDSFVYQNRKSKGLKEIKVDGVFVMIGNVPAGGFIKNLVDFSERGEIKINPKTNETKTKGLFAAGDVTTVPYKQIVVAAGEGAKAALSCYNYLKKLNK
jgi:thioredoxin-disulfide reductase